MPNAVWVVARLRAVGGWRRALRRKTTVGLGVALVAILMLGFVSSLRARAGEPAGLVPNMLFAIAAVFVVASVFQVAPLATWFRWRHGVRFGLTGGERALLNLGTNMLGGVLVLSLLNGALAHALKGFSAPTGLEWAAEGVDVLTVVVALTAAAPLGTLVLYTRGSRRWLGGGLFLALLVVLICSAMEPWWSVPQPEARGLLSVVRLMVVVAILGVAFVFEQYDPEGVGARTKGGVSGNTEVRRTRHARDRATVGPEQVWLRRGALMAAAEARMMLRHRQVRANLVASGVLPVVGVFGLRLVESGRGVLGLALAFACLPQALWVVFFANLLGFSATGARRLSMSSRTAFATCLRAKACGLMGLVWTVVLMQVAVLSVGLIGRVPLADTLTLFFCSSFGLVGLAGIGPLCSILLPRSPELHGHGGLYCSVLGMIVVSAAWLVVVAVSIGVVLVTWLWGGPWKATVMMTVLLVTAGCACAALNIALTRAAWSRRHLREWVEAA